MKKIVRIGLVKVPWRKNRMNTFCNIEIKIKDDVITPNNKLALSISGVEGPLHSGNCLGSCGQIEMGFKHKNPAHDDTRSDLISPADIEFAPGWSNRMWLEFLEIWHEWHMNDCRPNCLDSDVCWPTQYIQDTKRL
jgi:hypothetical protein